MQKEINQNSKTVKDITDKGYSKKSWRLTSLEGKRLEFFPVFELNPDTKDVEARYIELKFDNGKGVETFTLNYLDVYMFVYFICNEELRRNLATRYERKVNYIPYDITVQASEEEKATGIIKRRVELPVDELTMAIARNEAFKIMLKNKTKDPRNFRFKGK